MVSVRLRAVSSFCLSLLPSVCAYGIGQRLPTRTVGYGAPHLVVPAPTEAPSSQRFNELLKPRQEDIYTNICTEWTLLGGGQPACAGSSTCLFDVISGVGYEACALASSSFYQVTECWDYPQSYVISPIGQIFCGFDAPYCGYYEFIFNNGAEYSNFGCSTTPYASTATLLSNESTYTPITQSVLNAISTTTPLTPSSTQAPIVVTVTDGPTSSSAAAATTSSKKTETGPIVGGVVGGVAVLALLSALIFFLVRKRSKGKKAAEAEAAAATASAFHNQGAVPEKPGVGTQAQETPPQIQGYYKPAGSPHSNYTQSPHSPPPIYNPPPTGAANNYPELEEQGRVSTISTASNLYPSPLAGAAAAAELHGQGQYQYQYQYQYPHPAATELSSGGTSPQGFAQTPQQRIHYQQNMDMSGAPMNEGFHEMQ